MCRRLREDDGNVAVSGRFIGITHQQLMLGIASIGGGYLLWTNRAIIRRWASGLLAAKNIVGGGGIQVCLIYH